MKRILLLTTAAMMLAAGMQAGAQDAGRRDLKLMVRNSKGKLMRGEAIMVQVKGEGEAQMLDRFGDAVLRVNDADTVTLIAGNSLYEFPVAGFDSLRVMFRNKKRIEGYSPSAVGDQLMNTGYGTVARRGSSTASMRSVDLSTAENYSTLQEYMLGRVSGVDVRNGEVIIRGASSLSGAAPALIVVDGSPVASFATANAMVHPNSVASITVLKDSSSAAIYGARGAGGVVVITTKQGQN